MKALVIAEHNNKILDPSTFSVISAATKLSKQIDVLVLGYQCSEITKKLSKTNEINQVLVCDNKVLKFPTAEDSVAVLKTITKGYNFILSGATTFGKNLLPRIAAYLDVEQLSDVIAIEGKNIFKRPIYAGNAIATIQDNNLIKVITVRHTNFEKIAITNGNAVIKNIDFKKFPALSSVKKLHATKSERPELSTAKIVVSGGRGLESKENFTLIEKLTDHFGAAIGASRAAVDAGFVSNDCQVGQTGKIVAPELYIAVGISGAIQHLAGMKESKIIVAINKDPDAPIFQVADYGIIGDLFKIIPQILKG